MYRFGLQRKILLLALISALGIIPLFAQDQSTVRKDIWVCPVFESGYYGLSNMAFGGGVALGYGDKVALGLKVIYWSDLEEVRSLELNFLVRLYLSVLYRPETSESSGLFIQFSGGPVIFAYKSDIEMPSEVGAFSAGLTLGWRFLLGKSFFAEGAIRGGYPYIVGGGLSAGIRF
ncbi:MAG: hypothetical protein LBI28_01245 [Treponema sp.]|jgi:hypothetical protein|nr:hypothetical protein [Treponema sp.]